MTINGTRLQAGFITQQADDYQRIIIAFTRTSSAPPTYGLEGMYIRAGAAAKAWSNLNPTSASLIVAIPRARVASKWSLEETRSVVKEMISILDAAADDMTMELFTWGHRLRLRLVTLAELSWDRWIVCQSPNTIRYGEFELRDVSEVIADPHTPGKTNAKELIDLIGEARRMKLDRDDGYVR
ncbi:hypothetical protein NW755_000518 [Fusarium falciforme]|uniref:Uncharacterized protein n=1 Tax=Fusarium falciforme TaxID=195108 RepID=A0A9W8RK32_9HYPO|nr:hypothetical protein NW755_000518 [Fusarium falciforme]